VGEVLFTGDGGRLVTSGLGKTTVWDVAAGRPVCELEKHFFEFKDAAFTPDGGRLVTTTGDATEPRVFDTATGKVVATLDAKREPAPEELAVSPDGTRVVTALRTARVFDLATGRELLELRGHGGRIRGIALDARGSRIATASVDETVRVWDAATGACIAVLAGHDGPVRTAAFAQDGRRVFTTSEDDTARVWRVGPCPETLVFDGGGAALRDAFFSPDGGRVLTVGADRSARLWDAATGEAVWTLPGPAVPSRVPQATRPEARFSDDGSRLLVCGVGADGATRVLDASTGTSLVEGSDRTEHWAWFAPDGSAALEFSALNGALRLRDLADAGRSRPVRIAPEPGSTEKEQFVRDAAFTPDGMRIVVLLTDGRVAILDSHSGEELAQVRPPQREKAFNTDRPRSRQIWRGALVLSPDGSRAFSFQNAFQAVARDLRADGASSIWQIDCPATTARVVSPDGSRIVLTLEDGLAVVLDTSTGTRCAGFLDRRGTCAAWSPDGTSVAIGSEDRAARLWDARTGEHLLTMRGHGAPLVAVAFRPDGKLVLTASEDGTARLWPVDPLAVAAARSPVPLGSGGSDARADPWADAPDPDAPGRIPLPEETRQDDER
jgi:WD40 repeat protein